MRALSRLGALATLLVAASGCAGASRAPSSTLAPSAANAIDTVVKARIGEAHVASAPHELCRRLAIDVLGRAPTGEESAACRASRSIDAIVDAWMARPEHELVERRAWMELTDLRVTASWYPYVADADAMFGALAKGTMGYDELARRVVIHPAFQGRHPGDDWTRAIFTIFLGRTARADEVRAARPLVTVWSARLIEDAKLGSEGGESVTEIAFDFCACGHTSQGCASKVFGAAIDLGKTACKRDMGALPKDEELVRIVDATAAKAPLALASKEEQARLRGIGDALVARPDFWEAAVDRELRRYLGWWQSGFKRPESDLPEVRAALAKELAATKSLRALRRTILTSALYALPAKGAARGARWESGPRKLLTGERWLDSFAVAAGVDLGTCDHRFEVDEDAFTMGEGGGEDGPAETSAGPTRLSFVDPALLRARPAKVVDPRTEKPFDYPRAGRQLGGCRATGAMTTSSLGLAAAEREIAAALCAVAPAIVPGAGTLEDDAAHMVERFLARPATPAESARLAGEMRECLAANTQAQAACVDRAAAVRWLCTRIATSSEFGTY